MRDRLSVLRYSMPFVALAAVSLAAALLLQPSPATRLEGKITNLGPEAALLRLRSARDAGEIRFTVGLDMLQARLERETRNWSAATRHYRDALGRPDAPIAAIEDELATTALLAGDADAATDHLRRAQAVAPDGDRRRRLGLRLRVTGDTGAEIDLLGSVPAARLDPSERARLADLLFAAGDAERYATYLSQVAALDTDDAIDARADLLAHYATAGRAAEAVTLFETWRDRADTPRLAAALIAGGHADLAAAIAAGAVARAPHLGAATLSAFVAPDAVGAGGRVANAWLDATDELSADDWSALVAFTLRSGDLTNLRFALRSFASPPPEAFQAVLRYEGAAGLLAYRDAIPPEHVARMPLLGAGLAAGEGAGPQLVSQLVTAADPALPDWDRRVWAGLAQELAGTVWQAQLLRADMPPAFLRLATDAAPQGAREASPPVPAGTID